MRKSKAFLASFEARMGLQDRAERIWFRITFSLLAFYVAGVMILQSALLMYFSWFCILLIILGAVPLCMGCLILCRRARFALTAARPTKKKCLTCFLLSFSLTFIYLLVWQWAYWPGALSTDSENQFAQVLTGQYNNWHPVLHTWLFFSIPYKLFHSFAAILTMQLLWFSLAAAYLMTTLYRDRCPIIFMILGGIYILINPNTIAILLYPWKDSAMSIFALVFFTQLIQIYATDGLWLKKWYNIAAFTLFAFLTCTMRHNAILLIVPVFAVLFVFIKIVRKQAVLSLVCVIGMMILLQGPVSALAHVEKPGNRVTETMGLPITILCNVYMNDADALDEEAQAFMASLASPSDWNKCYWDRCDVSFNAVKWLPGTNMSDKIDAVGWKKLLQYTAQAVTRAPKYSLAAAGNLTGLVWRTEGAPYIIYPEIKDDNTVGIQQAQKSNALRDEFSAYLRICSETLLKYLFCYIGPVILLMLFAAVSCIGGGGLKRAFLVLAPLAYNFGTMLLLSGSDFRFFHFNFVVIVPMLFIFLMERRPDHGPSQA